MRRRLAWLWTLWGSGLDGKKTTHFLSLCSFGEHQPRKGTALNKDSVSDGIQGVVRRDSEALILGHWEMAKLMWEMCHVRDTVRGKFWCEMRWPFNPQWKNAGPQIAQGSCSCPSPTLSAWVTCSKPFPPLPGTQVSLWVELVHL